MTYFHYLAPIILVLILNSCANIKPITGGEIDKIAPKIVVKQSTPNLLTNYESKIPIILKFNEWIVLDQSKIITSPTTEFPLSYKLKGKSVYIKFDKREKLKENTTYTVQFGESIKDLTVGNIANNLKYVLSTGMTIDSLKYSGTVSLAVDNSPVTKAIVGLYENLADSAFKTLKPNYISWTNTKGEYFFENIKAGKYNLVALLDKNQNYYYDQTSEAFAFQNQNITIPDSNSPKPLILSLAQVPLQIKENSNSNGKWRLVFNRPSKNIKCRIIESNLVQPYTFLDSLILYYENNDTLHAELNLEGEVQKINLKPYKPAKTKLDSLHFVKLKFISSDIFNPKHLHFLCSEDIQTIQPSSFKLNGSKPIDVKMDSLMPNSLNIFCDQYAEGNYWLHLDSLCVETYSHKTNQKDSVFINLKASKDFARLELILDSLSINQQYIFELTENSKSIYSQSFIAESNFKKFYFPYLDPTNFIVKVIIDENKNNIWDPGDYGKKRQPEKICLFNIKELRADWDVQSILKIY